MHNFIFHIDEENLRYSEKSLGHAFHVNNFSVQERLTRESVYLCDGTTRGFLVRAT